MKLPLIFVMVLSSVMSIAIAGGVQLSTHDSQLGIVLSAINDCQPECAIKQYDDFKNDLDDTFDQHSGCKEKFELLLKQKKLDTKSWYHRQCIIQCLTIVRQEFAENEGIKGQVGDGAFGFWASKGAIAAVEKICSH